VTNRTPRVLTRVPACKQNMKNIKTRNHIIKTNNNIIMHFKYNIPPTHIESHRKFFLTEHVSLLNTQRLIRFSWDLGTYIKRVIKSGT